MPEHDLSQLLDRAVEHAPDIDLGGEQMLTAGKRRVRQRRTVAGGTAVGALALAAAVWTAASGSGIFATDDVAPAGTTTTTTQATETSATPVVAQDRTITLHGADAVYTFSDGYTTLGKVVLHLRADGTSSAEMAVNGLSSVDAPGAGLEGVSILGGGATAYRGELVTLVTAPLPQADTRTALLGIGEATGGTFTVEDQPMQWWAVLHGPDTSPEAGLPSDLLLVTGDRAELVSGAELHATKVADRDLLVWSAPTHGQWGFTGPESTSSTPGELLVTGTETETTWAAKVPLGARSVRLVASDTGDPVATAEWFVTVGDLQVAGGTSTWQLTEGTVVQWEDASGTPNQLVGDTVGGTGAFAGITVSVSPELELTTTAGGQELVPVPSNNGALHVYAFPGDAAHELVVLPVGMGQGHEVALLERVGTGYLPAAQGQIVAQQDLETASGALRLLKVPTGTFRVDGGDLLAIRPPDSIGAFNTWRLLSDGAEQGFMALDPGLVVALEPDHGWLLYRQEDLGDGSALLGGALGKTLIESVRDTDPETVDLVAVLEAGTDAELMVPEGFRIEATQTHVGPVDGYEVFTATVNRPVDGGPAGAAYGLDTDGDGQVDVPVR